MAPQNPSNSPPSLGDWNQALCRAATDIVENMNREAVRFRAHYERLAQPDVRIRRRKRHR